MTEMELAGADGSDRGKLERAAEQIRKTLLAFVEEGVGPITGSLSYAEDRKARVGDVEKAITRITRETQVATGTSGFVTGLGGLVTMPITIPAAFAGAALMNARMVGSIAHLRNYDLKDPFVQHLLLLVVAGQSANTAMREVGVKVTTKLATKAIADISIDTIRAINKKLGIQLLAKYGTQRSAITLAKAVPIIGGVVGGAVDATFTKAVSVAAKKAFAADDK